MHAKRPNAPIMNFVYILLYAFIVTPSASAGEIYKCVGAHGLDLYQNFPCQFDSMGLMPTDAQTPKGMPPTSDTNPERIKAATSEAKVVPKSGPERNMPDRGMTADEVKAIWGKPTGDPVHGLVATEITDGGAIIWTYGTTRTVQFDPSGRVSLVRY